MGEGKCNRLMINDEISHCLLQTMQYRYDGTLVGCAVYSFLSMSNTELIQPSMTNEGMLIVMALGFAVGVLHSSCVNMSKLPALTLAFNILIMAFILALARRNATVASLSWLLDTPDDYVAPPGEDPSWGNMSFLFVVDAAFRGVGQFCFVGTTAGGMLVLLGITICSRRAGCMALVGSLTSMIMCRYVLLLPVAAHATIRNGIYGYNAMGTCVSLGGDVFFQYDATSKYVAVLGAALTVLMQVATQSVLDTDGLGLPVLTVPFVLTTWMIMMSRSYMLEPNPSAGRHIHEDTWWHRPPRSAFQESPERAVLRMAALAEKRRTESDTVVKSEGMSPMVEMRKFFAVKSNEDCESGIETESLSPMFCGNDARRMNV